MLRLPRGGAPPLNSAFRRRRHRLNATTSHTRNHPMSNINGFLEAAHSLVAERDAVIAERDRVAAAAHAAAALKRIRRRALPRCATRHRPLFPAPPEGSGPATGEAGGVVREAAREPAAHSPAGEVGRGQRWNGWPRLMKEQQQHSSTHPTQQALLHRMRHGAPPLRHLPPMSRVLRRPSPARDRWVPQAVHARARHRRAAAEVPRLPGQG